MSAESDRRWSTFPHSRTVLAVARTPTSVIRLWDVLDLLRDQRVRVVFTVNTTSRFSPAAADLLRPHDVRFVPWTDLHDLDYDLVLTASENVDLADLRDVPVVVVPHGVGFHKHVPDSAGDGTRLSGMVPPGVRRRVLHVVTHPDQAAQLDTPTALAADPCYGRLRASAGERDGYRRALDVDGRTLVLLTSTWGEQSLIGSAPDLPARLLGELPADSYRVAAVLHPNVWARESGYRVRAVLADALDAGLMLVPPAEGWQATVIASDVVVGDHGSVTFYAAATGKPLLLGAFGAEAVHGTPLADLGDLVPRLDLAGDLRDQVSKATQTFAEIGPRALSTTGPEALRQVLYDALDLDVPPTPTRVLTYPVPVPEQRPVHSYVVHTTPDGELWRVPAAVGRGGHHLAVAETERDLRLRQSASVLVRQESTPDPDAWIERALANHPGAALVAVRTGNDCRIGFRDGRRTTVPLDRDPLWTASAVYSALRH